MRFYHCEQCGNMAVMLHDVGVKLCCCHREMRELKARFSTDKCGHEVMIEMDGENLHVLIGKKLHPMDMEQRIEWIIVKTDKGFLTHYLKPSEPPETAFLIHSNSIAQKVYCWCSKDGLWERDVTIS